MSNKRKHWPPARSIAFNPNTTVLYAENYGDIVVDAGHESFIWNPALVNFATRLYSMWILECYNVTQITQWAKQQKIKITKHPYNRMKKEKK